MTNSQKITAVIQAIGADIKALKAQDSQASQALEQAKQELTQAINQAKNEILGGASDQTLDTIKEIADKLKELEQDDSISGAITQKLTEYKSLIDELSQKVTALESDSLGDLTTIYTQAKGA